MWIARDKKTNKLFLYEDEPIRKCKGDDYFTIKTPNNEKRTLAQTSCVMLNENLFPEVTWENSPKEVELKLM